MLQALKAVTVSLYLVTMQALIHDGNIDPDRPLAKSEFIDDDRRWR